MIGTTFPSGREGKLVSIFNAFFEPSFVSIFRGLPEVKLVLAGRENRAQKGRMKTTPRRKNLVRIRTYSTKGFADLARNLKMTQERLAYCILAYFGDHPETFYIVSVNPRDARRDGDKLLSL